MTARRPARAPRVRGAAKRTCLAKVTRDAGALLYSRRRRRTHGAFALTSRTGWPSDAGSAMMRRMMHLDETYSQTNDEAIARLKALTAYWVAEFGLNVGWQGDEATIKGRVKGVKFDGKVTVRDGHVKADVDAGFLAEKLGGRRYVVGKLADYLDPDNSLESLQAREKS